jgi:hypothetical protein
MKRALVFTLVMAVAITTLVFAQGRPDFSGTWVLDASKSDVGRGSPAGRQMPMRTVTLVLKQTSDTLTIQRTVGEQKETALYKLDGSVSTNKLPSGNESQSTAKWVGATLAIKTTAEISDPESGAKIKADMTDVRSLSADGQVMTVLVTRQTPRGEVKQTLVYNKQK